MIRFFAIILPYLMAKRYSRRQVFGKLFNKYRSVAGILKTAQVAPTVK
ncbi:hypothetical protein M917_2381 [Psychrobacter aquaticus CMS 56]|uniref:Uncharacterized protein n=1 Tax=Psychrobacter aquaticus CMS 56 TaxID=1354303 RepID=U4T306_9GAMM|nr:hypothetical protein M917_2381 [Psychrobacter aquaticus CMS 56]